MNWNDERIEQLKKLWADGLSASQVAGEMGGTSRSAVLGKIHRLGLSSDKPRLALSKWGGKAPPPPLITPDVELRKGLQDLESNDCRWPVGDVREPDFHFCAKPRLAAKPYCFAHYLLARQLRAAK